MQSRANNPPKNKKAAETPNSGRRLFLFGLPVAGLALFSAGRAKGAMPAADQADGSDQPVYRETELVRRYYERARF